MLTSETNNKYFRALMSLGLTRLQATTYFNLVKLEKAGVKTIAKASNAYRSDAYRVMASLEKLGLAEKIVGDPVIYKATPLREGFNLLMQSKTQEYANLQQEATDALNSIQDSGPHKASSQQEDPQFVICSSEKLFFKSFLYRINSAKKSIYGIANWRSFRAALIEDHQNMKKTMDSGVSFRVISEKHDFDEKTWEIIGDLRQNSLFGIRFLPSPVPVKITLFDGIQVELCIALANGERIPSLWSNHPQLLKVMNTYFETMWSKAEDSPS